MLNRRPRRRFPGKPCAGLPDQFQQVFGMRKSPSFANLQGHGKDVSEGELIFSVNSRRLAE
jgi:hypothetical protein